MTSTPLDVAQSKVINDIIYNLTETTLSTQASEQLNYITLILQIVSFVAVGGFALLMKILYSRIQDKLFAKQVVIPERKEGSVTIPARTIESDGRTLEERIETRIKNSLDYTAKSVESQINDLKGNIEKTIEFYTKWNQRIEDDTKEVGGKVDKLKEELDEFKVKIAETIGFNAAREKHLDRRLDMLEQFSWGKETKSTPAYMTGDIETAIHRRSEGEGLFKDTEEEAEDRRKRNRR
jgi:hypothetical protein